MTMLSIIKGVLIGIGATAILVVIIFVLVCWWLRKIDFNDINR